MDISPTHEFVPVWGVHSSRDDQPVMRAWGRSESDARAQLAQLSASDSDAAQTEYWVVQMTRSELEQWKALGVVSVEAGT